MIKKIYSLILITILAFQCFAQISIIQDASDKAQIKFENSKNSQEVSKKMLPAMLVDPLIGTGGHGHTFPGVCAPFGMMQLSPDTRYEGWDGCGGYHYSDSIIFGFSHTHLSGTGVPDYGDLLIVPQSGEAKWKGKFEDPNGYGSTFEHQQEVARLGFYEVFLKDEQIRVNLSSTERSGIHQYTFLEEDEKKYLLLDLNYRDKLLDGNFQINDNQNVSGFRISQGWANRQHFYFHLCTSIPFISHEVTDENGMLKLLLEFPSQTKELTIKVGMSHVDVDGAKLNLETEIPHFSLNQVYNYNMQLWNKELAKINIQADSKTQITFYSALYHTMVAPNLISDIDGRYRGRDGKIHQLENLKDRQYTVFSLWDTYRANHPLFTLIDQNRTSAYIRTFLRQYEQGGDLPVWELSACETECMIGYHSVSVIADAYIKGIRDFDAQKALKAMVSTANADEFGKLAYIKNGLISSSDEPESVSRTLEYAYDDFCISMMANALGNKKVAQEFEKRSYNFVNLYDPKTKFMRARRGAQWYGPFDPSEVNFNYTEANSWQYSLYAPHRMDVLTHLIGGPDSLERWLDKLFTTDMRLSGREQADITGLIGQYAHGNEPSHHMAYLYNFTNAPHKTQFYVDRILNEMYHNDPDGLAGNEDCGQMSAWYVLSALGIYPVAPGNLVYQIGRPLISHAEIQLENLKKIQINCNNQSNDNKYIQYAWWNNQRLTKLQIDHETLMQGGILTIEMGPKPIISTPTAVFNLENQQLIAPVPYIITEERVFNDSLQIEIGSIELPAIQKVDYYYQLNGGKWKEYKHPFYINSKCSIAIKAAYFYNQDSQSKTWSTVVSSEFMKIDPHVKLELKSNYSNQYAASGKNALIDGLLGGNEFRTGDYQGFYNQDVVALIEFASSRPILKVGVSFIDDQKSWIFSPSKILVEGSVDGINFTPLLEKDLPLASPMDKNSTRKEVILQLNSNKFMNYKSLRYTIKNPGLLPSWHLGAGNPTWLFIDELYYE